MVQQQEYNPNDPPLWFGYDYEGKPLTKQEITPLKEDEEITVTDSIYSGEEEVVWPSASSKKNKKSRSW